jgi:hypothetical protein
MRSPADGSVFEQAPGRTPSQASSGIGGYAAADASSPARDRFHQTSSATQAT